MADGRDEKVWTNHAQEHRGIWQPHTIGSDFKPRVWLENALPKGSKVLDYGCGSALWKLLFDGYDYHGTDQNEAMIQVAKERFPGVDFQVTQWNRMPYPDASFDMIWTAAVIQHNTHSDKEPVIAEFKRVLKPGGLYMCTENTFAEHNYKVVGKVLKPDLTDGYSFTSTGWENYFDARGFELELFEYHDKYLFRKRS